MEPMNQGRPVLNISPLASIALVQRAAVAAVVLLFVLANLAGCAGTRLVVDVVPARSEMDETVVQEDEGGGWGGPSAKVALIDMSGLIADAPRFAIPGPGVNPVAQFVESLNKAAEDDDVKAVVLRINSRGGTTTASHVVYEELVRFRERTGKPVVILMADVAASGGYYLACGGDRIIAHPTTVTGSIGVIMQTFDLSEGMHRLGIRSTPIVSGPNKNLASPFHPMSEEQREILQAMIDSMYAEFVAVVEKARPALRPEEMAWVRDGRVVTGRRALELGLIDEIGDVHHAFDVAKGMAGVPRAKLVKYHRPIEYVGSAYGASPAINPSSGVGGAGQGGGGMEINLLQLRLDDGAMADQSGFYYLWDPAAW